MNNDMMPLLFYLLYSNDLKGQSDRIIQETKSHGGANILPDDVVASINSNSEALKLNAQLQQNESKDIQEIKQLLGELKNDSDPKKFADTMFATMKELEPKGFEKSQEFFDSQIKAANDISAAVSTLHQKLDFIDKLESIDKLIDKVTELEKIVLSQKRKTP
jgi:uncharacterized membrane-anchored protein YjiN (DUF445 family)